MRLCIDIGNTRVKLALFSKKGKLKKLLLEKEVTIRRLEKVLKKYRVKHAILSSVRKENKRIQKFLTEQLDTFVVLDSKTNIPVVNLYQTPDTLGRDRIAAIVGAWARYPNENVLVMDAGTCITYDFVTNTGRYLGGSILPGIEMRLHALPLLTANLPLVKIGPLSSFIGDSTETSIRTGVQCGVLFETAGFILEYQERFKQIRVVITGGDTSFFESQLKNEIFAEPNLVLIGLNQILEYNVKR
ncbi:MAG: type III pantothenate kinase [Aureispira sp.]|nr:type III pantothenate kinase [Aureispira sp.]